MGLAHGNLVTPCFSFFLSSIFLSTTFFPYLSLNHSPTPFLLRVSLDPVGAGPWHVTRRRIRRIKRGERNQDSNQIPNCSPQPGTPREMIHRYIEKRRGKKEIELTWRRKGRVKGGKSNQAINEIPKRKQMLKIRFLKVQN